MLEDLIAKELNKLDGDGVVYYNGTSSALILTDDKIIGVRADGTVTVATGHEWETVTSEDSNSGCSCGEDDFGAPGHDGWEESAAKE